MWARRFSKTRPARVTRGIVLVRARELGDLRPQTERAGRRRPVHRLVAPGQRGGWHALFDPGDELGHAVGGHGAVAVAAVTDAGREEEPVKVIGGVVAAHGTLNELAEVDGVVGGDSVVGQAMEGEELAAAVAERGQVRVGGVDKAAVAAGGVEPVFE